MPLLPASVILVPEKPVVALTLVPVMVPAATFPLASIRVTPVPAPVLMLVVAFTTVAEVGPVLVIRVAATAAAVTLPTESIRLVPAPAPVLIPVVPFSVVPEMVPAAVNPVDCNVKKVLALLPQV